MEVPGIEPMTSWLVVKHADHSVNVWKFNHCYRHKREENGDSKVLAL